MIFKLTPSEKPDNQGALFVMINHLFFSKQDAIMIINNVWTKGYGLITFMPRSKSETENAINLFANCGFILKRDLPDFTKKQ